MSMEGVRMLAKSLEDSGSRGVAHVYVHSEGRIDALGRKKVGDACQASLVANESHPRVLVRAGSQCMDESSTDEHSKLTFSA